MNWEITSNWKERDWDSDDPFAGTQHSIPVAHGSGKDVGLATWTGVLAAQGRSTQKFHLMMNDQLVATA